MDRMLGLVPLDDFDSLEKYARPFIRIGDSVQLGLEARPLGLLAVTFKSGVTTIAGDIQ